MGREIYLLSYNGILAGDRIFYNRWSAERYIGRTYDLNESHKVKVCQFLEVEVKEKYHGK